jgi:hypothetical protein
MNIYRQEVKNMWNYAEKPTINKNYIGIKAIDIFNESDADYLVPLSKVSMKDIKDLLQLSLARIYSNGNIMTE